ncbi:hypothetical protein CBR_g35020 [Chara braunii]|uniref:FAD dependent oxidoreductase domain-containing protein n=1 Tax=Chara braunii TaxID=69332 RepID=A0A388LJZ8_CHABU|nr:hypothetical protein CBR_g35020 [Chara braunii]|eukprot:GBG82654.1 hypothetical protein CBR_g35020 [Chara braunii]
MQTQRPRLGEEEMRALEEGRLPEELAAVAESVRASEGQQPADVPPPIKGVAEAGGGMSKEEGRPQRAEPVVKVVSEQAPTGGGGEEEEEEQQETGSSAEEEVSEEEEVWERETSPTPILDAAAGRPSALTPASAAAEAGGSVLSGPVPLVGESLPGLRHTVWDQQNLVVRYPPLKENVTADVCVVGAGINGLSVAYYLQRYGKKVVLLESRVRGAGQTGRTTAHLMVWNDDYYSVLARTFGRSKAMMVADSHVKAIDFVERVIDEERIKCDFRRVDGFLFPADDKVSSMQKLRKEYEACQALGLKNTEIVDLGQQPEVGQIGTCLKFPGCADFHPLRYLDGLAEAFVAHGGRLYEKSRVWKQKGNAVTTSDGFTVAAKAVVLATNSPINHNVAIHARQTAYRTYAIGLEVPKGSVRRAQFWDTAQPYHYVRLQTKGDTDVLIVGGEDHSTGIKPKQMKDAWVDLEIWARKRWVVAGDVLYKWTGQVYEPADYLGLYGPDPLNPFSTEGTFISTGNSGQGMTGGTISAMVIGDRILGRVNPWVELYNPKRAIPVGKPWASVGEEAKHTVDGYLDLVPMMGTDFMSIEDVPRGCGAVIQDHLMKVAAYRDDKGMLHRFSAVVGLSQSVTVRARGVELCVQLLLACYEAMTWC